MHRETPILWWIWNFLRVSPHVSHNCMKNNNRCCQQNMMTSHHYAISWQYLASIVPCMKVYCTRRKQMIFWLSPTRMSMTLVIHWLLILMDCKNIQISVYSCSCINLLHMTCSLVNHCLRLLIHSTGQQANRFCHACIVSNREWDQEGMTKTLCEIWFTVGQKTLNFTLTLSCHLEMTALVS